MPSPDSTPCLVQIPITHQKYLWESAVFNTVLLALYHIKPFLAISSLISLKVVSKFEFVYGLSMLSQIVNRGPLQSCL